MTDHNANDLDILARTMYGEARGEGLTGMTAVCCVVLNRLAASAKYTAKTKRPDWWGNTVSQVCQKAWQFSCWNTNDPNREKLLSVNETDKQFRKAMDIARQYLTVGGPDITNGATHYYAKYIDPPDWTKAMKAVAFIGDHVFYA